MLQGFLPTVPATAYGGGVTKTILTRQTIGIVGAVLTGIALWRFTSGDWLGGIVFAAAVAGLGLAYWLQARRPRDTRRY
jgi:hypothetical protein